MPEHLRITVFFTNRRKHTFVNFMECLSSIRAVCNALGKLFPCAPFIIISGCRIEKYQRIFRQSEHLTIIYNTASGKHRTGLIREKYIILLFPVQ